MAAMIDHDAKLAGSGTLMAVKTTSLAANASLSMIINSITHSWDEFVEEDECEQRGV